MATKQLSVQTQLRALVALFMQTYSNDVEQNLTSDGLLSTEAKAFMKTHGLGFKILAVPESPDSESEDEHDMIAAYEFSYLDETCIVVVESIWNSYNGFVYSKWYFGKAKPVQLIEYVRE